MNLDIVLMETVIRSLDSNLIVSDQAVDINDFKSIKNEFIDKLLSSNEWSVSIHNLEPIYARIACQ